MEYDQATVQSPMGLWLSPDSNSPTGNETQSELEMSDLNANEDINVTDDSNRTIGLFSGVNLIIGMMIGSGIFASPGGIMSNLGSGGASLFIWLLGGILSLFGALCYAELGTLMEEAGAEQAYLGVMYGNFLSFEYSWFAIFIGRPCSISIMLFVFSEYLISVLFPNSNTWEDSSRLFCFRITSIICAIIITTVNCISSRGGVLLQNVSTVLKIAALIILALSGVINYLLGRANPSSVGLSWGLGNPPIGNYVLSLYYSLWAYDGWNNLNFITPELKNPSVTLVRSISIAVPIVISCYLLTNIAYFLNLTADEISTSTGIGALTGEKIFGPAGSIIISLCVAISTFGGANATIFTGGRLMNAAAELGYLPFSEFFITSEGPSVRALILQCVLSILFTMSGQYNSLIAFFSWTIWIFYGLTVIGLIILRFREPEKSKERKYKVPLILTIPFLLGCLVLILVPFYSNPVAVVGGIVAGVIAVPGYFILVKKFTFSHLFYRRVPGD